MTGILVDPLDQVFGQYVDSLTDNGDGTGTLNTSNVPFPTLDFTALFGAAATSGTYVDTADPSPKQMTLNVDNTNLQIGTSVEVTAGFDPQIWFYGIVVARDNTVPSVTIVPTQTSFFQEAGTAWTIQVTALANPGVEADISSTSVDPTTSGPFTFTVTANKFFPVDGSVLCKSLADPSITMFCRIASYSSTSLVLAKVSTTATVSASYSAWNISTIDGSPIDADLITLSLTSNTIGTGSFTFTVDAGKFFPVGAQTSIIAIGSPSNHMAATVTSYSGTTMTVFTTSTFGSGTFTSWSIENVGGGSQSSAVSAITGFSSTSLQFGSTHDIYIGATVTLTTDANKYFDIGSSIIIADTSNAANYFAVNSQVYQSTSLVGIVTKVGPIASGTITSWVLNQDSPPGNAIPLYQLNGLRVTQNVSIPTTSIDVSAGSVRDSTNTIDLVLPSAMTKDLTAIWAAGTNNGGIIQSANLAGTISSGVGTVTGTGTAFVADFGTSAVATLTDFTAQGSSYGSSFRSLIAAVGSTIPRNIQTVTDNTHLTYSGSPLGASGSNYVRGGRLSPGGGQPVTGDYGVCIVYKIADGTIDIAVTAFTGSGAPDLPSGYSYYRVLGRIHVAAGAIASVSSSAAIDQPLIGTSTTFNQISPMTVRGDIITQGVSGAQRVGIGAANSIVSSDGTDTVFQTRATLNLATGGGTATGTNTGDQFTNETASTIIGRGSASGAGAAQEITLGTNLAMSGTTLNATAAGGTVTTTGSPASGNLTKFSGTTSVTNADLTGDLTTAGTVATTLATVNSNVGSFGSATQVPTFTVNGKGLTTAASNVTISGGLVPIAVYGATITPTTNTTLGLGAISAVDATNDIITITAHGLTTGEQILALAGWPAGTTNGRSYYVNALSANTLALYLTRANAVADTSRVNITATTTGGTWKKLVRTNEFTSGMATSGAVGFDTGSANIGLDFNIATSITKYGQVTLQYTGLTQSATAYSGLSITPLPSSPSTTLVAYPNANLPDGPTFVLPTTQATQATTAFTVYFTIWGS